MDDDSRSSSVDGNGETMEEEIVVKRRERSMLIDRPYTISVAAGSLEY